MIQIRNLFLFKYVSTTFAVQNKVITTIKIATEYWVTCAAICWCGCVGSQGAVVPGCTLGCDGCLSMGITVITCNT